jgi:hypothetical protein
MPDKREDLPGINIILIQYPYLLGFYLFLVIIIEE